MFTSDRVDDILNEYSFSKKEEDTVGTYLRFLQSKYLLDLAGICLCKHTQENWLYQLFLDSCAFNKQITVSKCNEILISKGLAPMTNLRVLK